MPPLAPALPRLWQAVAAAGAWSETLLPPPAEVPDAFLAVSTARDGVRGTYLVEHPGISLRRIAFGAGVGIVLGVLLGLVAVPRPTPPGRDTVTAPAVAGARTGGVA